MDFRKDSDEGETPNKSALLFPLVSCASFSPSFRPLSCVRGLSIHRVVESRFFCVDCIS